MDYQDDLPGQRVLFIIFLLAAICGLILGLVTAPYGFFNG